MDTNKGLPRNFFGTRFYRECTRKLTPRPPHEATDLELLMVATESVTAAKYLMAEAEGDIRNLAGLSFRELAGIPGVGPGTAGKVIAMFQIAARINETAKPEPLPLEPTTVLRAA